MSYCYQGVTKQGRIWRRKNHKPHKKISWDRIRKMNCEMLSPTISFSYVKHNSFNQLKYAKLWNVALDNTQLLSGSVDTAYFETLCDLEKLLWVHFHLQFEEVSISVTVNVYCYFWVENIIIVFFTLTEHRVRVIQAWEQIKIRTETFGPEPTSAY